MSKITAPEEFFGFALGSDRKMARWDKIVEYFNLLDSQSDRIQVIDMGPSTMGNPFLEVIITSPENFAHLEEIRKTNLAIADPRGMSKEQIDALVQKGKAVCVQSMSLHASEIGGTQMAPQLAHDLLASDSEDVKRILDNVVFMGKAVCVQSMSLHASEIGGTQMAPQLAHDLLASDSEDVKRILDNVVFIMVPCFNPDGQIMMTDWYYENLDTPYEGCQYPKLYHKYTGHDNNRDAFAQNIIESVYMGKIIFHDWMPQAYQDHHHMGSFGARLFIAPYKNPLRPYHDPILWRELNWYGANMAYQLESKGLDGVTSGAQFPSWGHYGYHWITNSHNIAGMLTESANAKLATPLYIDPANLKGDGDNFMPEYEAQTNFPSPWPGGWWRIGDVMKRQYTAAYALLDTMAKNREAVLRNMTIKALNQTKRGEESETYAFIIPQKQYDKGVYEKFIKILQGQNIELKVADKAFTVGHATYEAGTIVVFLAQPKYALIMNLLGETHYPDNIWTRDKNGALSAFDSACDNVNEFMGVDVIPANQKFEGEFSPFTGLKCEPQTFAEKKDGYVLSAKENEGYHAANLLLQAGCKVFRIDMCPFHDFYVEGDAQVIEKVIQETGVTARTSAKPTDGLTELKPLKVAMYERYYAGNAEEGWTRLLFETYGYKSTPVLDDDIIGGALKDYDVLILPSDEPEMLYGPKYDPTNPKNAGSFAYCGNQPPKYQSGLGTEGARAIKEFVENGGRLLTMGHSCDYAIKTLGIGVKNVVGGKPFAEFNTHGSTLHVKVDAQHPVGYGMPEKDYAIKTLGIGVKNVVGGKPFAEFNTHGSTLHVKVDAQHPVGYGMPEKALILHWNGPVFEISDTANSDKYHTVVRFAQKDLLKSGLLVGEKLIAGKAAMLTAKVGKGEVYLYGFAPQQRMQTHGTFKLLFNALYR